MERGSPVETAAGLARRKIRGLGQKSSLQSDAFTIGNWKWYLSAANSDYSSYSSYSTSITLYILPSRHSEEQPPKAKFVLRVSDFDSGRQLHVSPVQEILFVKDEKFVWEIRSNFGPKFVISVEFLELKLAPVKKSSHLRLSRMFQQNIHADITINTAEGALHAHKAVLVASSPVFQSMFEHDLQEKKSSILEILDMSMEACNAFVNYLYGIIKKEDLWKHRQALLSAADKYNIVDLKECCEETLIEDLTVDNVLDLLLDAQLYQLNHLKEKCLMFLFDSGKIFSVRDIIDVFLHRADRQLVVDIFQTMLGILLVLLLPR